MKKLFIYLSIYLIAFSSKAQDTTVYDLENRDLIIFNFLDKDINITDEFIHKLLFKHNKTLFMVGHRNPDLPHPRFYEFYKKNDTMKIRCGCGQGDDLYIDNMSFQKGYYEINIFEELVIKKRILGKKLFKNNNKLKKIIFNNMYQDYVASRRENLRLQDINFFYIDNRKIIWRKMEESEYKGYWRR